MMTAFALMMREHWPKVLAAILVPVILGAIALHFQKEEREVVRQEKALVEQGETKAVARQQERTIENVKAANDAVERPSLDATDRVYRENDRCARDPAACQ